MIALRRILIATTSAAVIALTVRGLPGEEKDGFAVVRAYVKTIERPTPVAKSPDLDVSVTFIPDAFVYNVARAYLEARDKGRTHHQALEDLKKRAREFRKLRKSVQLSFDITTKGGVFTTQVPVKKIPGGMIALLADRKKISSTFAAAPTNVKQTSIRIRKYLGSEPGLPEFPRIQDPFKPSMSKPIKVLMFEGRKATFPLLVKGSKLESVKTIDVGIGGIKKYNGTVRDGAFDVALRHHKWTLIKAVKGGFDVPATEVDVPEELEKIALAVELKY